MRLSEGIFEHGRLRDEASVRDILCGKLSGFCISGGKISIVKHCDNEQNQLRHKDACLLAHGQLQSCVSEASN